MQKEVWKDIIGYEGLYQVSNLGRVKSLYDGRHKKFRELILRSGMDGDGYLQVKLYKDGKPKSQRINRLVAMAFIPIPDHLKHIPIEELDVEHIDGNKENNRLDNLRWNTHKGNMENPLTRQHMSEAQINGRCSKSVLQLNKTTGEVIRQWPSAMEVERQLGYAQGNISACCRWERKSAYGFKWSYA